jgi:NitT/TauT family transport system ATP-binding protein
MLLKLAEETTEKTACLPPPCIQIRGGAKTYRSARGDVQALGAVDLEIGEGEFLSVVGPSGCGKSTLMRCVAGLQPLSSGEITLKGAAVKGPAQDLGIVFQRDLLLDWRTVIDNVLLPAEFRDQRNRSMELRAMKLLEKVGLAAFADRYPWELSGGMRQRVAICRALVTDPPVLLMDEPFGALDALTRDDLNAELQTIWMESRKTVLFITHGISEAAFLSDRVVVMSSKPGRVLEIIKVDLPRPRPLSIRDSSEFSKVTARIRQVLAKSGAIKG